MARRRTQWIDTVYNIDMVAGTQVVQAIDGGVTVADGQGRTLTRVIGRLAYASNTVAGAWGTAQLSVGFGASSREAFSASPPALPDPGSATEEPLNGWIYRDHILVSQNGAGAPIVTMTQFDLHTQRKLDSGRHFSNFDVFAIDGTTFNVVIVGIVRCLYLLP